ncbi:DUF3800 domain-containing protein [Achromobacter xylosoxidans]
MKEQKPFTLLQAAIDDSGSDKGDRRLFMAGYISTAENWASFSDAWVAELRSGKPINYLKMREANSRDGEFYGWTQAEVNEKLTRLKAIIDSFKPMSFHNSMSRSVDLEAFRTIAPRGLSNAHLWCTFGIVSSVCRFVASQKDSSKIEFIFDTQVDIEDELDLFFEHMAESIPDEARALIARNPRHEDDKTFAPLQAADMLAWHIRRRYEDHGSWMKDSDDLAPINSNAHLECGDLNMILPSIREGVAEQMKGVVGLKSKGEWQRMKKQARRLKEAGYVPPASASREAHIRAFTRWQRISAFKNWLRGLFWR